MYYIACFCNYDVMHQNWHERCCVSTALLAASVLREESNGNRSELRPNTNVNTCPAYEVRCVRAVMMGGVVYYRKYVDMGRKSTRKQGDVSNDGMTGSRRFLVCTHEAL